MAARHKRKNSVMVPAKGGGEPNIAIPGVDVMKEAKKGSSGFKKGGGVADGSDCPPARMDKPRRATGGNIGVVGAGMAGDKPPRKARGGAATMRGRSPLSSASSISPAVAKTTH